MSLVESFDDQQEGFEYSYGDYARSLEAYVPNDSNTNTTLHPETPPEIIGDTLVYHFPIQEECAQVNDSGENNEGVDGGRPFQNPEELEAYIKQQESIIRAQNPHLSSEEVLARARAHGVDEAAMREGWREDPDQAKTYGTYTKNEQTADPRQNGDLRTSHDIAMDRAYGRLDTVGAERQRMRENRQLRRQIAEEGVRISSEETSLAEAEESSHSMSHESTETSDQYDTSEVRSSVQQPARANLLTQESDPSNYGNEGEDGDFATKEETYIDQESNPQTYQYEPAPATDRKHMYDPLADTRNRYGVAVPGYSVAELSSDIIDDIEADQEIDDRNNLFRVSLGRAATQLALSSPTEKMQQLPATLDNRTPYTGIFRPDGSAFWDEYGHHVVDSLHERNSFGLFALSGQDIAEIAQYAGGSQVVGELEAHAGNNVYGQEKSMSMRRSIRFVRELHERITGKVNELGDRLDEAAYAGWRQWQLNRAFAAFADTERNVGQQIDLLSALGVGTTALFGTQNMGKTPEAPPGNIDAYPDAEDQSESRTWNEKVASSRIGKAVTTLTMTAGLFSMAPSSAYASEQQHSTAAQESISQLSDPSIETEAASIPGAEYGQGMTDKMSPEINDESNEAPPFVDISHKYDLPEGHLRRADTFYEAKAVAGEQDSVWEMSAHILHDFYAAYEHMPSDYEIDALSELVGKKELADGETMQIKIDHVRDVLPQRWEKNHQLNGNWPKIGSDFAQALEEASKELDTDPDYLAAMIDYETAGTFSADAMNPNSSATGILQKMADGNGLYFGMTREQFAGLSETEQVPYLVQYMKDHGLQGKVDTPAAVYVAIAAPSVLRNAENPDLNTVIYEAGTEEAEANAGWQDANGNVTVGSLGRIVEGNLLDAAVEPIVPTPESRNDNNRQPENTSEQSVTKNENESASKETTKSYAAEQKEHNGSSSSDGSGERGSASIMQYETRDDNETKNADSEQNAEPSSPENQEPATRQDFAQHILRSGNVTGNPRYMAQIEAIANGDMSCNIDRTILGILAEASEHHTIKISSLNRRCTGVITESGTSSRHYAAGGGYAVDLHDVNGVDAIGNTQQERKLVEDIVPYLPPGSKIGQSNCRTEPLPLPEGVGVVPDACNHLHISVPVT